MVMSCTQPPSTAPTSIHSVPGRYPNCAASVGTDQRTGSGNRSEVMAEHDPSMGRNKIPAIVEAYGRRRAAVIDTQHTRGDPGAVEAIADGVDADRSDHDPHRIDRFAAMQSKAGDCKGAGQGNENP